MMRSGSLGFVLVALCISGCNDTGLKLGVTLDGGAADLTPPGPTVDLALPAPDGGGGVGSDCITNDTSLGAGNCQPGSFCLTESDGYPGGICVTECSADIPCPDGAICAPTEIAGAMACFPACKSDKDCRKGYSCSQRTGACRPNFGGQAQLPAGTTASGDACVTPPVSVTTAWQGPIKLAAQGHYSGTTQIVADPIGKRLFAVWTDFSQQSDGIAYAFSSDDGATFGAATMLPRDATSNKTDYVDLPSATIDPAGGLAVAWLGYSADSTGMTIVDMNVFVAHGAPGAATLDGVAQVTPSDEYVTDGGLGGPFVSASPKDGTLAVTWTQVKPTTMERNIRLSLSKDQGATWSTPLTVSETAARPMAVRGRARSAFGADGQLYVIWVEYTDQEFGSTANAVYLQRFDAEGKLQGGNVEVSGETDSPGYDVPSLAVSGSKVAIAFASGDDTGAWDVRLVHSLDGGATFAPSVKINDDATCATHFRPTIAFDAGGVLQVVFYDNRYLQANVFYATVALESTGPVVSANQVVTAKGFRFSTASQGFSVLSDYLGLATSPTGIYTTYTAPAPMQPPTPLLAKLPLVTQ